MYGHEDTQGMRYDQTQVAIQAPTLIVLLFTSVAANHRDQAVLQYANSHQRQAKARAKKSEDSGGASA